MVCLVPSKKTLWRTNYRDSAKLSWRTFHCAVDHPSNDISLWVCPHAMHVLWSCKYCNLWSECLDITFAEHHLLGCGDENVLACPNVSWLNTVFCVQQSTGILPFNSLCLCACTMFAQFKKSVATDVFKICGINKWVRDHQTLHQFDEKTSRVLSLRSRDIMSVFP
jgi:hypothetical protein